MGITRCLVLLALKAAVVDMLNDTDYHRGPWNYNPACPAAVTLDPPGMQRNTGSEYGGC